MNMSFFLFPEDLNSMEKRARDPAKVTLKFVTFRFVVQLRKIICVFNVDVFHCLDRWLKLMIRDINKMRRVGVVSPQSRVFH